MHSGKRLADTFAYHTVFYTFTNCRKQSRKPAASYRRRFLTFWHKNRLHKCQGCLKPGIWSTKPVKTMFPPSYWSSLVISIKPVRIIFPEEQIGNSAPYKSVMNTRTSLSGHNGLRCGYSFFSLFWTPVHENRRYAVSAVFQRNKPFRVLSIRIEKKVNYFYEVTTSDWIRRSTLSVKVSRLVWLKWK